MDRFRTSPIRSTAPALLALVLLLALLPACAPTRRVNVTPAVPVPGRPASGAPARATAVPTSPAGPQDEPTPGPTAEATPAEGRSGPRGYLTTPQELAAIARKAHDGIEPYA